MTTRVAVCARDTALLGQVCAYLQRAGYSVIRVADPSDQAELLDPADVLVVDEEAGAAGSETLHAALRRRPAIYLQGSRDARLTCRALREGYRECLLMPEDLPLLSDAIARWADGAAEGDGVRPGRHGCRVMAVYSGSGGAGRTVIAAHLAAALAGAGLRTLAVDLSLHLGALREAFGHDGTGSLINLLPVLDELNETHLQNAADRLDPNLDLLAAPAGGLSMPLTEQEAARLLETCRRRYQALVLDLPCMVNPVTAAALLAATDILYLLEPTAVALWTLGAVLGRLDQAELPRDRIKVVLNRRSPHLVALTPADVQKLYGLPVLGEIPFDAAAPLSPVLKTWESPSRAAGLARDVERLAGRLLAAPGAAPAGGRRRVPSRAARFLGLTGRARTGEG